VSKVKVDFLKMIRGQFSISLLIKTSPRNDLLLSYLLFFLTDQHTTAQVQVIYDIKETKYNSN